MCIFAKRRCLKFNNDACLVFRQYAEILPEGPGLMLMLPLSEQQGLQVLVNGHLFYRRPLPSFDIQLPGSAESCKHVLLPYPGQVSYAARDPVLPLLRDNVQCGLSLIHI